jgi:CBS domain-containing protein
MRDRHVGALLVFEEWPHDDRPVGMITDRDIVVHAVANGASPHRSKVGEIMTPGLATVLRSASVADALEIMRSRGVRRLAVAEDDGKLAGIVSLDDIVDAIGWLSGISGILRSEIAREAARQRSAA